MKGVRSRVRILLIDEEGVVRDGLCALINSNQALYVAHVLGDTACLRNVAASAAVDLIIGDFAASSVDPVLTVGLACERWPNAPILVFTFDRRKETVEKALRLGVDGYLLKSDTPAELFSAIQSVLARKQYISPALREGAPPPEWVGHSSSQYRTSC